MTYRHGRPIYLKLSKIAPHKKDYNLVVKVVSERVLVDKTGADGKRARRSIYVVADDTGCMDMDVHGDLNEDMKVGSVVALHNVKVKLVQERMRIGTDKWSSVDSTTTAIRGDICSEPNFSAVSYARLESGDDGDIDDVEDLNDL